MQATNNHISINKNPLLLVGIVPALLLAGCGGSDSNNESPPAVTFPEGAIMLPADDTLTTAAKNAFINAKSGDVIVFPQGTFSIKGTLTFDADSDGDGIPVENITIVGYGMGKTILNFENSTGGDGLFVQNGKDVTIKDLGVYEAAANAIKFKNTDGIILKSVATVWEGELNDQNGAYGLYPVESKNILIEDSYVRGSADAGIYVGQSENIVVRRNIAEENVAGIEIENSINADVYDNIARKNTGGILIFDLPIGNDIYGTNVRVFDNEVLNNNEVNFAKVGDFEGGVHIVPPGTGIIVLSTNDVEIYKNRITDHKTTSIVTTSYYIADENLGYVNPKYTTVIDDGWEAVPRNISIHDNEIQNSSYAPTGYLITDIITGFNAFHQAFPAILYDGLGELVAYVGADATTAGAPFSQGDYICSANNGNVSHGVVFDPEGDGSKLVDGAMPDFLFEASQTNLMACATMPAALSPSKATINGTSYGCGEDDASDPSSASCAL
ncbi:MULTISPECIES: parallel beta-helix domain-containing protein [Marinobacter]|uniref:mannuronan 5-epimerase n=1 Tax=Marinobacter xiaoshiensis TaxID=3073652 RepID=A0ABU2HCC8_9GAMM|nr:parallel beta-helix domain-containing protein [Marinobacter sp. F60267]MDS1308702.1 parallel beta-helix domain-containing protein [Marinobacter sp. F60267]